MDRAHEDLCGPAIAHLYADHGMDPIRRSVTPPLQRVHTVYGDPRYERLADLSVSHLYNLRKRTDYQALRVSFVKTRAVCNPIGLRKAPRHNGRAGFVRIDTVHQCRSLLMVTLGVGIVSLRSKNRAALPHLGHSEHPAGVRHGVEYATVYSGERDR